jgi:hypothetical protein
MYLCSFYISEIKRFIGRTYQEISLQNKLQYFSFKVEDDFDDPIIVIQGENKVLKKNSSRDKYYYSTKN